MMMNHAKFLISLGSAIVLAGPATGCSSSSPGPTPASTGAGGNAGASPGGMGGQQGGAAGAGGASMAGPGGGGGSDGTAGGAGGGAPTKFGGVVVTESSLTIGTITETNYTVGAFFLDHVAASAFTCTHPSPTPPTTCTVSVCTMNAGGAGGAGGAASSPSAGGITVSGGADPVSLIFSKGVYSSQTAKKLFFQGGEALTVTASGADVPAFSGTVTAPKPVMISNPPLPAAGSKYTLDTTTDLMVTWAPGNAGDIVGVTVAQQAMAHTINMVCTFDAASGSGVVPSLNGLDQLSKGDGTATSALTLSVKGITSIMAGDYLVQLVADYALGEALLNLK